MNLTFSGTSFGWPSTRPMNSILPSSIRPSLGSKNLLTRDIDRPAFSLRKPYQPRTGTGVGAAAFLDVECPIHELAGSQVLKSMKRHGSREARRGRLPDSADARLVPADTHETFIGIELRPGAPVDLQLNLSAFNGKGPFGILEPVVGFLLRQPVAGLVETPI